MTSTAPRIFVSFWGTRGSISTPGAGTQKYGGNTPCVSIHCGRTDIILDAGTGIRDLGIELAQRADKDKTKLSLHLLLSHTHWDHIQGLPFFSPAYLKGTKMAIYGSPNKERFLAAILQRQMDMNYFPVEMNALAADLSITEIAGSNVEIGPFKIDWQEQVCHPGGSVRYSLNTGGKKIVYATDVELDKIFGATNKMKRANKTLAREYSDFIHGADLLIADGQYTELEYPTRAGWGHSSIKVLIEVAGKSGVKQLAVFHHDPQHTDTMLDLLWDRYAKLAKSVSPSINIFWAREGMTITV
jgi:phosphoribosyl 1,2-cyclic phosphodiesterase